MSTRRYATSKKPSDPTFSAQWSGVTGGKRITGEHCERCQGAVYHEAGSAYCPHCDDYVHTVRRAMGGYVK